MYGYWMSVFAGFLALAFVGLIVSFESSNKTFKSLGVLLYVPVFAWIFSPFLFELNQNEKTRVAVMTADSTVDVRSWGAWEWENYFWVIDAGKFGFGNTINVSLPAGSVTPITDNPKARKISYSAIPKIIDKEKYFANPEHRMSEIYTAAQN